MLLRAGRPRQLEFPRRQYPRGKGCPEKNGRVLQRTSPGNDAVFSSLPISTGEQGNHPGPGDESHRKIKESCSDLTQGWERGRSHQPGWDTPYFAGH